MVLSFKENGGGGKEIGDGIGDGRRKGGLKMEWKMTKCEGEVIWREIR